MRHDLLPVAAYFFGRGLEADGARRALPGRDRALDRGRARQASASSTSTRSRSPWWRSSGALRLVSLRSSAPRIRGAPNLPENLVYNPGNEHPLRRLVSTYLSPLASSYLFLAALLLATTWLLRLRPRLTVWLPTTALLYAGLLWTHSRSSYLALSLGLLVFAAVRPQWRLGLVAAALLSVAVGFAFVKVYPRIAPVASYTARELKVQRQTAHAPGAGPGRRR